MNPETKSEEIFEKSLTIMENENLSDYARNIQNELELAGWYLPWNT